MMSNWFRSRVKLTGVMHQTKKRPAVLKHLWRRLGTEIPIKEFNYAPVVALALFTRC